jgi:GDP-4-dehydro-6-deoxy-D-mannose reductase
VRASGASLRAVDIGDAASIDAIVAAVQPDLWIHHGGWATAYASRDYDFAKGLEVNALCLDRVYARLADSPCRGVIVTGSSAEYSDSDLPNGEADFCQPEMPYGLAKLAETLRARQLARFYGLATRVARVYIPFGSLDAPRKLLSTVVQSLRTGKATDLSPCTQRRDFIHVDDLVRGYLALADDCARAEPFDIFNLCSGVAVELRAFLQALCEIMGADPDLLRFGAIPMRPGEPPCSYGDPAKAERLLGWQASDPAQGMRAYLADTGALAERA